MALRSRLPCSCLLVVVVALVVTGCAVPLADTRGAQPGSAVLRERRYDARADRVVTRASTARTLAGSNRWRLTRPATHEQIQGYTDPISGTPGTAARLMVSTTARRYRVQAWRIGGYRGGAGRLVWHSAALRGHERGRPALLPRTNTIVAHWPVSLRLRTRGWSPGFYLLKLVASTGYQAFVPYTVRSPSMRGRVVLMAPEMDWQAYDNSGGYSLYTAPPLQRRSWAVSFDRPQPPPGAGQFLFNVVPVVRLAERLGLPLGYATDVDTATDPSLLAGARAVVSLGHDEYWSVPERRNITRARDAGTNLALLSSNDLYWRVRLRRTATGPARLLIGYKEDARTHDPARFSDPAEVTGRWRDGPRREPENSLTGMRYECYPVNTAWRVRSPRWWGYRGTGVSAGTAFPHLVQMEADRVYPVPGTPHPLQIIAYSPYDCQGVPTSSESVYYTVPSGAGVVTFGTQWWPCALQPHCVGLPVRDDRFARQVMRNVLRAFAAGPAGRAHPARDNVARFHLSSTDSVPVQ